MLPESTATALLPVVQVCAVAPASQPTPSSKNARAAFIPTPVRDMLSIQSIATQAEASCKHGDVNPTNCQNPAVQPTPVDSHCLPHIVDAERSTLSPRLVVGGSWREGERAARHLRDLWTAEFPAPQVLRVAASLLCTHDDSSPVAASSMHSKTRQFSVIHATIRAFPSLRCGIPAVRPSKG